MDLAAIAREVRYAVSDPRKLCDALGLSKDSKPQGGGLSVRCPAHGEKNPSCSVTRGPDGTVRVRCFGCDFSGDALTLIAQVHGLTLRGDDFRQVLAVGAEISGQLGLREEILSGRPMPERKPVEAPPQQAPAEYPPQDEVARLWNEALPVCSDADAWEALRARAIDPEAVDREGVLRVLPTDCDLPSWARYRGRSWLETGHRLLVAMWDCNGRLLSVRGWRIGESDSPKRLPPAGHRATALVMANRFAWQMLTRRACPRKLVVVEGEPDFVTAAMKLPDAVIGVISGSWDEYFAEQVPSGTQVIVATHNDDAGDRYAEGVIKTLGERCPVWRAA
jgi:hypothetical protein